MSTNNTTAASRRLRKVLTCSVLSIAVLNAVAQTTTQPAAPAFGTFNRLFAADSLWNSRPINPVLGTFVIPKSSYYPVVAAGATSSGLFQAKTTDGPVTVSGITGTAGVADPDSQNSRTVTVPRWPANVVPTANDDQEADIYDPVTNVIHSFWGLRLVSGKWYAKLYAWSDAKGPGFGDPAHFYQGSRAAGVIPLAGMIRASEVNDGQAYYSHALAMSMTYNGLSGKTPYIYPATSADINAASTNTGGIPQGALLMLPASYDTTKIANPALRKVAETLKRYGAYVVDRNDGTPFAIHVEGGVKYDLHNGGWDNAVATELDRIRANLRQVVSATSWVDGNGQPMTPKAAVAVNQLSMRGPWTRYSGTVDGVYDTITQSLNFPAAATQTVMVNGNSSGINKVVWGKVTPGTAQKFTVTATGGAKLKMQVYSGGAVVSDTGALGDKASARVTWPATGAWFVLTAYSGVNQASTLRATLTPAQ
ncbi:Atrophin-1 multi-domain protein [Duganella sp. FT109W]|uniref:Atrophin-1 multi-domain protein n=1 Tax=Duganella margarita TaxID=2692170 RepID=A0ABW9WLH0_9BURK|nr:Atrophin-1 multi-domain protein [Duganella margarita]MYN42046.1 Atrophin-1 multi-domain protein [Duganella margarita]